MRRKSRGDSTSDYPVFFYKGFSMRGTFKEGDCLFPEKIDFKDLRRGDVVIYYSENIPGNRKKDVHRVVRRDEGWISTRGDWNRQLDVNGLKADGFIGRVKEFERNQKRRRVKNGIQGHIKGIILHKSLRIVGLTRKVFNIPYKWLKHSGLVGKVWKPEIKRIRLNTEKGELIKLTCKNRTIAWFWKYSGQWIVRRPYDLIIDADWTNRNEINATD